MRLVYVNTFLMLITAPLGIQSSWARGTEYSYYKMSLTTPWMMYFIFLALVLIPFVIMIFMAWRREKKTSNKSGTDTNQAS